MTLKEFRLDERAHSKAKLIMDSYCVKQKLARLFSKDPERSEALKIANVLFSHFYDSAHK